MFHEGEGSGGKSNLNVKHEQGGEGLAFATHRRCCLFWHLCHSTTVEPPKKRWRKISSLNVRLREAVAYKSVDHIGPELFSFIAYYGDFKLMLAMLYSRGKVNFEKQSVTIY